MVVRSRRIVGLPSTNESHDRQLGVGLLLADFHGAGGVGVGGVLHVRREADFCLNEEQTTLFRQVLDRYAKLVDGDDDDKLRRFSAVEQTRESEEETIALHRINQTDSHAAKLHSMSLERVLASLFEYSSELRTPFGSSCTVA